MPRMKDTYFYPRSPRGERHKGQEPIVSGNLFLSTLPARGATYYTQEGGALSDISIHAPREGSDSRFSCEQIPQIEISIHAPREGSDGV